MVYGDLKVVENLTPIPVHWNEPYADQLLVADFPITVDNRGWVDQVIDTVQGAIDSNR